MIAERIPFYSHSNGFRKCLEYGLYFMMLIFAVAGNIQITTCSIREGFEEMKEHLSWHIPYFLTLKMRIPDNPTSASEIQQDLGFSVVHRQNKSISFHAPFIS